MPDWETIVRDEGPLVFRVAWRILRNVHDAEDVMQEALLEFYQRLNRGEPAHRVGLLKRMATCRALDSLRRRRPFADAGAMPPAASGQQPEQVAIARELAERLRTAIARLPEQTAAVFSLRYFENLSYAEIAAALSISETAVATLLSKARSKIADMLDKSVGGNWTASLRRMIAHLSIVVA